MVAEVLNCKTDNIALVNKVCSLEDDLLDSKDDMINVKNFFATQKTLFDTATDYMQDVMREKDLFLRSCRSRNCITTNQGYCYILR